MIDIEETYIENRTLVNPNDTNNYDMAHGGNVMKWMDEVGAMSAMRFAGQTCVTARMESVNFHQPIPRGDAALIESYVYAAGRTSVKVRLRVFREDPLTGDTELTTESYVVYVAVDEDGDPTPVPELETNTEYGRELLEAAVEGEKQTNGHD
ncbi:acyl-CoA thioesterase [Halogeometricum sp. CBA1124]|uniref:acyl-CoA thioesterase n=1 Tax=Halogeometricum sp. CBA1124 TaxID=2668071 RepID=UPI001429FC2D|nr:acyl-CoA thioesterase [Halogeometricum sp. CBA1124]MUV58210.1 acyl-CoA thioesterase [Halogeometricum sp. CBA1124]